jgi:hypothetical protein
MAPPDELVRYLAIIRRTFVAIEDSAATGDRDRLLLALWAADAIHNVPSMLRHYSPDHWHSPDEIARWMRGFQRQVRGYDAPRESSRNAPTSSHDAAPPGTSPYDATFRTSTSRRSPSSTSTSSCSSRA